MKRLLPPLALAALVSTLAACGGGGGAARATPRRGAASNIPDPIVWCVDTTYPPAESLVNGKAAGYDIDIANAVAKQLGSTAQIKTTGFTVIIPALKQKKCNAIISSMTITPDRAKQVHFIPYLDVGSFLMVKKGNPFHITGLASLSGKSAAVEASTTQLAALQPRTRSWQKQGKPLITIKSYPADTSAVATIEAGKVTASCRRSARPLLHPHDPGSSSRPLESSSARRRRASPRALETH